MEQLQRADVILLALEIKFYIRNNLHQNLLKITILVCGDSWIDLDLWYIIDKNYWRSFTELLKLVVIVRTLFSFKI